MTTLSSTGGPGQARGIARRLISSVRGLGMRISDSVQGFALKRSHPHLRNAFSIPSHLTTRERVTLSRLAEGRATICEIGSYIGASASCFGETLRRSGSGRIFCIDTWNNEGMAEGIRDTFAEFQRNTAPYARFIVPVRGFSTDVVGEIAKDSRRIDLLFIDGDHSYEGVKADWESYKSFLVPGSVVVFHDCGWADGVMRVIEEDARKAVSSCDRLPNMWWGTIGGAIA